jgi:dTDP-4-amino-4,6-dideoxy-D-galactose acyltransferase
MEVYVQSSVKASARPIVAQLNWECRHFGFVVAELTNPQLSDSVLAATLLLARRESVRLLVWPALGGRDIPCELLNEYGGALVDRKATYCKSFQPGSGGGEGTLQSGEPGLVVPYTKGVATPALIDLAISAGVYSRFHVDSHFARGKFEAMYRRWIERSVRGEMADEILVLPMNSSSDVNGRLGGMITLSESAGLASIGLFAVAADVRGAGIGSALMSAAHRWMLGRGVREAKVVTQLANVPACRFYERAGYRPARIQHIFHFWL